MEVQVQVEVEVGVYVIVDMEVQVQENFKNIHRCFPSYDSPIRFAMDRTATTELV